MGSKSRAKKQKYTPDIDKKKKGKQVKKQVHKPKVQRTSPAQYIKEVRLELKKVAWPDRPKVISSTIIVIITVIIFGLYAFGLDSMFQYLLKLTTGLK